MAHTATLARPKEADPLRVVADPNRKWTSWVAVSAAILAALASIGSLLSGQHADEAMIEQMRASNQWAFYQAKGIKDAVLESKLELLPALGKEPAADDTQRVARYKQEQAEIKVAADAAEHSAQDHRHRRAVLGRAVTAFQVGIALCALGLLTRKQWFWGFSLVAGAAGMVFMVQGLLPA